LLKSVQLFSLLPRRPAEFLDRASAAISAQWELSFGRRPDYEAVGVHEGVARLRDVIEQQAFDESTDLPLMEFESRLRERLSELPADAPFARYHNGDTLLGQICYAIARAIRPSVVVETGVCYGVTSSYLLKALEINSKGHLHSIDLPPLGKNGDDYVGWLIPDDLRARWTIHRGASGRLLGPLLEGVKEIDLFVHDSLHTYRNMSDEFAAAWSSLRPGGLLVSDDIQYNSAFMQLTSRPDVRHSVVLKEQSKGSLLGVAVKARTDTASYEGGGKDAE
jgi:predicted O-methyltransferase YrrM